MPQTETKKATPFNLGIFIPHFQEWPKHVKQLRRCLDSIKKYEPDLLIHTLVVDDRSYDFHDELEKMRAEFGIGLIRNTHKSSYSQMVNQALQVFQNLKYTHICTMNNDIEIISPLKDMARESFELHPRIMVVGGLLFYPNASVQAAGFEIQKFGDEFRIEEYEKHRWGLIERGRHQYPHFVHGVTGALQFIDISKAIFVGGYNTKYRFGFEDVEFCLRAWMKGGMVYYNPRLQAVHCESSTRGRFPSERELKSFKQFQEDVAKLDFNELECRLTKAKALFREE